MTAPDRKPSDFSCFDVDAVPKWHYLNNQSDTAMSPLVSFQDALRAVEVDAARQRAELQAAVAAAEERANEEAASAREARRIADATRRDAETLASLKVRNRSRAAALCTECRHPGLQCCHGCCRRVCVLPFYIAWE